MRLFSNELGGVMARESIEDQLKRWENLRVLQEEYRDFKVFLDDVQREVFGWTTSEMQFDIADYLHYGGDRIMIQAQRGQAKSTITLIFAVWYLIQNPKHRVLIISAGSGLASDIATGIVNVFKTFDVLEFMLPDKASGDRSSTEKFDLHYTLRGSGKEPSIKCMGITASKAGNRADLLISDDVESETNSATETQRATLEHQTREYTSICIDGRIVYLGTPQSMDSIYNLLPSKGYDVRIWTGRYPTVEQEKEYQGMLAPYIVNKINSDPSLRTGGGLMGDQGKATDDRINEEQLQKKELEIGTPHFMLQFMLSTALTDKDRYPLNLKNLLFLDLNKEEAPAKISWLPKDELIIKPPTGISFSDPLYKPHYVSHEMMPYTGRMIYIDPAGGGKNGDETGYCVTYFLNGYIFVMDWGGIKGGYDEERFHEISKVITDWDVNTCLVEKNYGYGAFSAQLQGFLSRNSVLYRQVKIEEDYSTGQKEKRIIDGLEPVIARHHLIINMDLIKKDIDTSFNNNAYSMADRKTYSGLFQFSKVTLDKGSLIHDDRLESMSSAVKYWVKYMAMDADKMIQKEVVHNILNWEPDGSHLSNKRGNHRLSGLNIIR